jgi:hypothetical protein
VILHIVLSAEGQIQSLAFPFYRSDAFISQQRGLRQPVLSDFVQGRTPKCLLAANALLRGKQPLHGAFVHYLPRPHPKSLARVSETSGSDPLPDVVFASIGMNV